MSENSNGGPAFPRTAGPYVPSEGGCVNESEIGMSLLDYFAAAALPIAVYFEADAENIAENAFNLARAMLAESEKSKRKTSGSAT